VRSMFFVFELFPIADLGKTKRAIIELGSCDFDHELGFTLAVARDRSADAGERHRQWTGLAPFRKT
jgi:hypothetical protein